MTQRHPRKRIRFEVRAEMSVRESVHFWSPWVSMERRGLCGSKLYLLSATSSAQDTLRVDTVALIPLPVPSDNADPNSDYSAENLYIFAKMQHFLHRKC